MYSTVFDKTFTSADGRHHVYAAVYRPPLTVPVRAVLQLTHGMIDHSGRYRELCDVLAREGYAVGVHDHLGHGRTAFGADDRGHFADRDGVSLVLSDMHTVSTLLREEFPGKPLILIGHSMGSFLARLYATRYPHELSGLVLLGTAGPNPLLPVGHALCALLRLFGGATYRSRTVARMAFMGYNSHFDRAEGERAWLSSDAAYLDRNGPDPYTDFIFTVTAYRDLFRMLGGCNKRAWYRAFPKDLPTVLMSGSDDPVGAYGKGPSTVYRRLLMAGASRVELCLYDGARHELFNEVCRDLFLKDLLGYLEGMLR